MDVVILLLLLLLTTTRTTTTTTTVDHHSNNISEHHWSLPAAFPEPRPVANPEPNPEPEPVPLVHDPNNHTNHTYFFFSLYRSFCPFFFWVHCLIPAAKHR